MIIVTKNQFIRAHAINHIILDELVENIQVGYKSYAMKKYLITVVYTPENGNPNQHNSELRECTVALTSRKEAYLLFKDMTHQIREHTPDDLHLNKILEGLLSDVEIQKIADSESGENFKDEMKAVLYDPSTDKISKSRKAKRKVNQKEEKMIKKCKKCGLEKSKSEFYAGKGCKDGLQTQCKDCIKTQSQARSTKMYASGDTDFAKTKIKAAKKSNLKIKYGITPEIYQEMLLAQNNKCAVCDIDQNDVKYTFQVDHCHKTGKVRDLLCYACNSAEGFIKSDPDIAIKLANYLIKHRENK